MTRALAPIIALCALASLPAAASEAAMAKLVECMKIRAATPEQRSCLDQVEALHRATPKAAMGAPPRPMAAKVAGASKEAPKTVEVPANVKSAAATVGLNGVGPASANLSGLDLESAMMAIQSRRANLLESQLREQMDTIKKRNDEVTKALADLKVLMARQPPPAAEIAAAKAKIDQLNSTQQMDMLRMQSLTNKRNEAFDLMTNFIKKMADSRSSIIGNMR